MRLSGLTTRACGREYNRARALSGFPPYKGKASLKRGHHGPVTTRISGAVYTLMLVADGKPVPAPAP